MSKPKIIVFASGSKDGGGSGFKNLVTASRANPALNYEVVAVVSNHENGGVRAKADELGVPFIHFAGPFVSSEYQRIVRESGAEWVALSGWLKLVSGLDPARTFNIHPAPLPDFGGPGMYGHYTHEAVMEAYLVGDVEESAVTMHFVTEKYDEGPVFFRMPISIERGDDAKSLGARVNQAEHYWQPLITNMVVNGEISWDGKVPDSLVLPWHYKHI